jgi:hypothetical protein
LGFVRVKVAGTVAELRVGVEEHDAIGNLAHSALQIRFLECWGICWHAIVLKVLLNLLLHLHHCLLL